MRLHSALCAIFLLLAGAAAFAQPPKPKAPSNVQAIVVTPDTIVVAWDDNSNDESGFRVEGRTGSGAFVEVGSAPANIREALVDGLQPATTYVFRVQAVTPLGNSNYSEEVSATTPDTPGGCAEDSLTLCLGSGRFQVRAAYQTGSGQTGEARVVKLTGDSGYLWFFQSENVEVIVKIVDACSPPFQRFWFFAAGLTNVAVQIDVTDTETGITRTYTNPLNQPFPAIQDTEAFDTCVP